MSSQQEASLPGPALSFVITTLFIKTLEPFRFLSLCFLHFTSYYTVCYTVVLSVGIMAQTGA